MAVNNHVVPNPMRKGLGSVSEVERYGRQLQTILSQQPGSQRSHDYRQYELRERPWQENTYKAMGKGLLKAAESTVNFIPDVMGASERVATFSDYVETNPYSTQFGVVEDLSQLGFGLIAGGPIKKGIQKTLKSSHKYLRDKQLKRLSKRGRPNLSKAWSIASEGALRGGIAELLAFRGQDEALLMEEFFDYHPEWKKAYDQTTAEDGWEKKSLQELSFSFQNSLKNIMGRGMFAVEGALMGAAANFLMAGGRAAWAARQKHKVRKAGQRTDKAGELDADAVEAGSKNKGAKEERLEAIREKQEAAAFKEQADAREALDKAHADATERAGKSRGDSHEDLGRDTDVIPDELDSSYIARTGGRDITEKEGIKDSLFVTKPLARADAEFTLRHISSPPPAPGTSATKVSITDKNVVQVDRDAIQTEYMASREGKQISDSTSFQSADVFDNAIEYEKYLIEREKAKKFFPQMKKESTANYQKRLEQHSVNEAKRRGLGNFYKYEFNAPKNLKHLELTEEEKMMVLFKKGVDAKGVKRITQMLNGRIPGVGPARILKEAEELFRLDTSSSDTGVKYFQGRLMHFFMNSLRDNVENVTDKDTMAKAIGYLHDPEGSTLMDIMGDTFLDGLEELAGSHGLSERAMMHRLMKGRGTAKHFYGDLDSKAIREKGVLQDEKALREMNVRVLAYRMEQVIGMKRFRHLTKKFSQLGPDELKTSRVSEQYIEEMERQAEKIKTMQKLKESSGRVLRAWRDFNDPAYAGIERGEALTRHGSLEQLQIHAKRTDAIIDGSDDLLDASHAAADALVKRTKMIDIHNEYWLNAILSGTKTQVVNTLSTGLHMYYKPMEGLLGAALSGNKEARAGMVKTLTETAMINAQVTRVLAKLGINKIARKAGLRSQSKYLSKRKEIYKGKGGAATDSYEQAVGAVAGARKSFRTAEGTLTKSADLFDTFPIGTIGRHALSENASEVAKETVDYLGNMIRIPSRIMISTDELYKQISFRAASMGKLSHEAVLAGKTSVDDIAEYVGTRFNGMIRADGKRITQGNLKEEAQRLYAKEVKDAQDNMTSFDVTEEDFVRDHMTQHSDPITEKASDYGMHWAEDSTFTRRLDADLTELQELKKVSSNKHSFTQGIQDFVNEHPFMRLMMPFIKTPVNILKWPMQRMAFIASPNGKVLGHELEWVKNLHMRYQADMASGDALRAAQAKGRLYAGRFYWTGLLFAAYSETITGAGPSNPRKRQNWMATGRRPYSVRIGDTYVSYARLDPFALPMGLAADIYEKSFSLLKDGDVDEDWLQSTLLAGAYSLSHNMADKSYLAGINNVLMGLTDPEHEMEGLIKRHTTSYIPRIVSQWTPITDDHYMKKTYGLLEGITSRIPFAASGIEPMRNYVGEPMEAMYEPSVWASGINPFMMSKANKDRVLGELEHLEYGFGPPSPKIKGSRHLDMRKFRNPDRGNQSAFDRYQEVIGEVKTRNGHGIREALAALFDTPQYKRASELHEQGNLEFHNTFRDPRVKWVKAVMYKYRAAAKAQVLREYPDLRSAVQAFDNTVTSQLIDLIKT